MYPISWCTLPVYGSKSPSRFCFYIFRLTSVKVGLKRRKLAFKCKNGLELRREDVRVTDLRAVSSRSGWKQWHLVDVRGTAALLSVRSSQTRSQVLGPTAATTTNQEATEAVLGLDNQPIPHGQVRSSSSSSSSHCSHYNSLSSIC